MKIPKIPDIPDQERTPSVIQLLEVTHYQTELIQNLRDQIAILKGDKPKPDIKPSGMENNTNKKKDEKNKNNKRPGSDKREKTALLKIHKEIIIPAENIPEGSEFKGYKDFVVQGIIIEPNNILYRMERWRTKDGKYVEGELPSCVNGHFDSTLKSYILYQYFQCHVTQPLIFEQLREFDIDISKGQINNILIENHEDFHIEKDEILSVGLVISSYINVDDTGARHKGENGVCTHIGNELFAWFESTQSKSRINFLKLLRAGQTNYCIDQDALDYMNAQKLPQSQQGLFADNEQKVFGNEDEWEKHLQRLVITAKRHKRIATEGALIGSILENGINRELVIMSDDAGQFNVLLHALCWVHAERTIHKIIPFTEEQRIALELMRDKIWKLYADLNDYKVEPNIEKSIELKKRFDDIFQENTCFTTLNLALKRLHKNKSELLLVLQRPEIPLHNNGSESDIREYVKRRKVSGGTQSAHGRQSRDTFISLKKTCRKLGLSFWEYINDRVSGLNFIASIPGLMRKKVAAFSI
ncbi:MAG: transposase [Nitrospirae bacterium]|nr:transposase [Nitrospirota bacterium]